MIQNNLKFFNEFLTFILSEIKFQTGETLPIPREFQSCVWVTPSFNDTLDIYDISRLPGIEEMISLVTDCLQYPEGKSAELMELFHPGLLSRFYSELTPEIPMEEIIQEPDLQSVLKIEWQEEEDSYINLTSHIEEIPSELIPEDGIDQGIIFCERILDKIEEETTEIMELQQNERENEENSIEKSPSHKNPYMEWSQESQIGLECTYPISFSDIL